MAKPSWLHIKKQDGTEITSASQIVGNLNNIQVTADAYTGYADRTGSVKFKDVDHTGAQKTLSVTQKGKAFHIVDTLYTLNCAGTSQSTDQDNHNVTNAHSFSAPKNVTVAGEWKSGEVVTVEIIKGSSTIGKYTYTFGSTGSGTWAVITDITTSTQLGKDAEFSFTLKVTLPKNPTVSARKFSFAFDANDTSKAFDAVNVDVNQTAGDAVLVIAPESMTFNASDTAKTLAVTSNCKWTIE